MRWMTSALPWLVPGVVVSILIGLVVARPLSRWLGTSFGVALLLVVGFGAVLSATIPPDHDGLLDLASRGWTCDLSRTGPASPLSYLRIGEASLNVLLFVPLGLAVGLLPGSRRAMLVGAIALTATFAIEATQALVPMLGRGCEAADLVDNLLGLGLGFLVARLLSVVARLAETRSDDPRGTP